MSQKKKFTLPHILWIVFGLLIIASTLTYIIPAGQFGVDADGNVIASEFTYLESQTPVSLMDTFLLLLDGIVSQARIMALVMVIGANTQVLLEVKAIDSLLNWIIYRLQDKGKIIVVIAMFILMVYIGGFAGSDALIALVPIGVVFSKKLNLDPIVALGLTTFPAMVGFATGPSTAIIPQSLMGVQLYSGFGARFVLMNVFMLIGLVYLLIYIRRIERKDSKSLMYDLGWRGQDNSSTVDVSKNIIKKEHFNVRSFITVSLYIGQYIVIVYYSLIDGSDTFAYTVAVNIITFLLIGLINKLSWDQMGDTFAKGINSMGFVVFIIGLAGVFSLILKEGNIMDTIVYTLTSPLMGISKGFANMGIAVVVGIAEIFIPSASSKAALIAPIITPTTDMLDITRQSAVQAYQIGDRWPNLISPVLGWLLGSLITAKVPYTKWLKWVLPILLVFLGLSFIVLYFMTIFNWTGL